jgi:hypothetical protein
VGFALPAAGKALQGDEKRYPLFPLVFQDCSPNWQGCGNVVNPFVLNNLIRINAIFAALSPNAWQITS